MMSRRIESWGTATLLVVALGLGTPAWGAAPVTMTARQCPADQALANGYITRYDVAGAKARISQLTLTHINGWSGYDAGGATIRLWHGLPGDDAELYRVFDEAERSILYTSSGLALLDQSRPWHRVAELADTNALTPVGGERDDCGRQRHYTGGNDTQMIDVWAYADSGLVTALTVRPTKSEAATPLMTYRLAAVEGGSEDALARVARWRGYQSTDFADIGDNESDPFLQRMIHQGFIEHAGHRH